MISFQVIALVLLLYLGVLIYIFQPSPFVPGSKFAKKNQTVGILVLGDIGRSPRMQYHALSLSNAGFKVQLIGYKGSQPHESLLRDPNIKYQFIPPSPDYLQNIPNFLFPLLGPVKVLYQIFFLSIILGYSIDPPAYILVQNPPAIPTLALARLICWQRNAKLVVDWHNLGYSILALKLGKSHPFVSISRWYERIFGRDAYAHLTVTNAMSAYLKKEYGAPSQVITVYDRPPTQFKAFSAADRIQTMKQFEQTRDFDPINGKLLISSTSWTQDEDFSILLDALVQYDQSEAKSKILAIITGKGPMKAYYQEKISMLRLEKVTIRCAWLAAEDYPRLLACADLGVCLHTSSSGLDLPMKVVDMFGCGVPVCAISFPALSELVKDGQNGIVFSDAATLSTTMQELFANEDRLLKLKEGSLAEQGLRWQENWEQSAAAVFQKR